MSYKVDKLKPQYAPPEYLVIADLKVNPHIKKISSGTNGYCICGFSVLYRNAANASVMPQ